ncbi:MAG: hypothetical protein JWQ27_784 [Ferruginibacter sp.]|nr:hypothetical protein [Ferruginibacter sp.]
MGLKPLFYIIIFALLQFSCKRQVRLPDMKESYGIKEAKPFGAKAIFRMVRAQFPASDISTLSLSFNQPYTSVDTGNLYVSISSKFLPDEDAVNALLNFIYKGNTAFIAAGEIDSSFLQRFYWKQTHADWPAMMREFLYKQTSVSLADSPRLARDSAFGYYYLPLIDHFTKIDEGYGTVLSRNEMGAPNAVGFGYGKGAVIFHAEPRVFSNYFLLTDSNYRYAAALLKKLPANTNEIFWDDFYNKRTSAAGNGDHSSFETIFKSPQLTWAFWLTLALLLFYILFNGKRRQRIVPVEKPVQNASVAFAEAIAGLYLKERNNKSIADKMITYFNEQVRSRYYLTGAVGTADFIQSLSRKAAVPVDKVETLYRTMASLAAMEEISDYQLLNLNEQIQYFYKTRN